MKICIFGAGGVGSYLAAIFAKSGLCEVSVIARGAHLQEMRRNGLTLKCDEGAFRVDNISYADHARDLPQQDFVFVTVKAHGISTIVDDLAGLVAPGGAAIFANNGIPWWWNHGLNGAKGHLEKVDPGALLWNRLGPERALGCVLYSANALLAPGVVEHLGNNRWLIAEPDGTETQRVRALAKLMQDAGLNVVVPLDMRREIWTKLLRNAPFNSLCALTRLPANEFPRVPGLIEMAQHMVDEVITIAAVKGWVLPRQDVEQVVRFGGLMDAAAPKANALPSMLQDALQGRPMEVEAILGQICEFAKEESLDVPNLLTVLTILKGLDASLRPVQYDVSALLPAAAK